MHDSQVPCSQAELDPAHENNAEVHTEDEERSRALGMLAQLEAEADCEISLSAEARRLQEAEAVSMAPNLDTLAYLPPREVAMAVMQVLHSLVDSSDKACSAELRSFSWAHEWLVLPPADRVAFTRRLVEGLAGLESPVQALHLEIIAELRLARFEPPDEETDRLRLSRGCRAGQAAVVVLSALAAKELDALGKVFSDTLSEHLTPIGAAKAVVHMRPARRRQLEKLVIYESILSYEDAHKLFRAVDGVVNALGVTQLEILLSSLDGAVTVGGSALYAGGHALDALSCIGSGALGTIGTVGAGVVDGLADVAAASAGAAVSLLQSPYALAEESSDAVVSPGAARPTHVGDFI